MTGRTTFSGALFAYPWPFHREGLEVALDRLERAGCGEVVVTPVYHRADFLQPHDPDCPVLFGERGAVFFGPDEARYAGTPIRPQVSRLAGPDRFFEELVAALRHRGFTVSLWVVYNFMDELTDRYPQFARHDPFRNPHRGALSCGASAVQAYFGGLTDDLLARFEPARVWVESLDRRGLSMPGKARATVTARCRFLLALDCNPELLQLARREHGFPADDFVRRVAGWLRERLAREPEGDDLDPADEDWIAAAFDGQLARYLDICRQVTTALWADVADRIHAAGAGIHHLPVSASTTPDTDLDPSVSRRIDRLMMSPVGEGAADQVRDARALLADGAQVYAGLHGSYETPEAVARDVRAARAAGCDGASFYAYGLLREQQLDWIGQALKS